MSVAFGSIEHVGSVAGSAIGKKQSDRLFSFKRIGEKDEKKKCENPWSLPFLLHNRASGFLGAETENMVAIFNLILSVAN